MQAKAVWDSKTILVNLIIGVITLLIPSAQGFISENPEISAIIVSVVNIILRLLTKSPVSVGGKTNAVG